MTAESEVSNVSEVAAIEEKCGLGMSAYQDLPKPASNGISHHNLATELDKSYVFVTGADGLSGNGANTKDVVAESPSDSPEIKTAVEDQGAELDTQHETLCVVSSEDNELMNEGENEKVKQIDRNPPLVGSSTPEQEISHEVEDVVQVSVANSLEAHIETTELDAVSREESSHNDVVAEGGSVSPKSNMVLEDQGVESDGRIKKLDVVSGKSSEHLNEDENGNMEGTGENPPLASESTPKQETSLEDGDGIRDSVSNLEDPNGKVESWTEVANNSPETFDVKAEPEVSNSSAISGGEVTSDVTVLPNNSPATSDVKVEPGVLNSSATSCEEMTNDVTATCRTEVLDNYDANNGGASNIVSETEDVEDMGDQLDCATGSSNENLFLPENEDTGNSHSKSMSMASLEGSSAVPINGQEASAEAVTKPFNFLIRIPRFGNESLREQIRLAKLHVDEKTKLRNAIQVQIQEKRANNQIHGVDYECAKDQDRSARKLVRSKRMEIDSLHSVINKAKNALSIEDINRRIDNMEYMMQHETLPLKEEKQLIRDIKQLKQLREQLSCNMGSQDEIKQALEKREEVEERVKILRKELYILKGSVLKAEAAAVEAEKKYDCENEKIRELQTQFRAANDVRQTAYVQWQTLRQKLSEKNKHFFKYKDDAAAASNYAFTRNREELYRLCTNQVEIFMELWNTNDEFRKDYVKSNTRSTVRRFGNLDGRSLGPDEEPPILPSYFNERVNKRMVSGPVKVNSVSQIPTLELKQEISVENVNSDDKSMNKVSEHENLNVTIMEPTAKSIPENGLVTVSDRDVTDEEPKKSKEEIELMKEEEEKRREKAEAELKEQRRLEELAKANEARERKKRQAEKLQMRAELKALKETEQKEKEKEKRLKKKERKSVNENNNCETSPSSESSVEIGKDIEVKDITKKPQKKHWPFTKQSKTKSVVPPPLRNRNKKFYQHLVRVGVTSIVLVILFWLGNVGVILKWRNPVH